MVRGRERSRAGQPDIEQAGVAGVGEPELLSPTDISANPVYVAEPPPPPAVKFSGVSKWFGSFCVLDNIDLTIDRGETVAVIGPSGAGKSTLIRCVNGLEHHDAGELSVFGKPHQYDREDLIRLRRQTGMVFQEFNLFPDYTALLNVVLPQRLVLGRSQAEAESVAIERLTQVGIADQIHKPPHQMSGGQQQRVAIARTLAMEPEILLLDEITASVDPELTKGIMEIIREVAESDVTIIAVSHELGFVKATADRVLFFDEGQLVEEGTTRDVMEFPRHERTKAFLSLAFDENPSSQTDPASYEVDAADQSWFDSYGPLADESAH